MTINCRNKADVYKYDHDVYFNVTIFFNYLFKKVFCKPVTINLLMTINLE